MPLVRGAATVVVGQPGISAVRNLHQPDCGVWLTGVEAFTKSKCNVVVGCHLLSIMELSFTLLPFFSH